MSTTEITPGGDDSGEANGGHGADDAPPPSAAAEGGATLDISQYESKLTKWPFDNAFMAKYSPSRLRLERGSYQGDECS